MSAPEGKTKRPEQIPEDIQKAAGKLAEEIEHARGGAPSAQEFKSHILVLTSWIARALLAERKRCAERVCKGCANGSPIEGIGRRHFLGKYAPVCRAVELGILPVSAEGGKL